MRNITLGLLLVSACTTNNPNFKPKAPEPDAARIYVYWPRQWQSQWGKFKIYFNNMPYKILKNEGYLEYLQIEGEVEIKSHHFQDENFIVLTRLLAQKNKNYYFKLDTQPREVTLSSAISDVLSIGTVVNGVKSEAKMNQTKTADWDDIKNKIEYDEMKNEQAKLSKETGHHVLLPIEEAKAIAELKACCTSKETEEVEKN